MVGVGEHVHRLEEGDAVAALLQQGEVARLRFGAAADVDDALGGHFYCGGEELRGAAAAGWVHEQDVNGEVFFGGGLHPCGGIGGDELDIFDSVFLGVADGIPDGGRVLLDPDDLAGMGGGDHADGADAAIGVQHLFPAGQPGGFDGAAVQDLGLGGVDLIKGPGRDAEAHAAEGIPDEAGAVEGLFPVAQQDAGAAAVYILHDGGDLRVGGEQRPDEILAGGELRRGGDQHHHDLPGADAAAHQHMTQKAGAGVLIVGGEAEGGQQSFDGGDDGGGGLVFVQAALDIDDAVTVRLVGPGDDTAGTVGAEGGLHLIAVVAGVRGAQNGLHPAEAGEVFLGDGLLMGQLLPVGEVEQLAAAAAPGIGAGEFFHRRLLGGVDSGGVQGCAGGGRPQALRRSRSHRAKPGEAAAGGACGRHSVRLAGACGGRCGISAGFLGRRRRLRGWDSWRTAPRWGRKCSRPKAGHRRAG